MEQRKCIGEVRKPGRDIADHKMDRKVHEWVRGVIAREGRFPATRIRNQATFISDRNRQTRVKLRASKGWVYKFLRRTNLKAERVALYNRNKSVLMFNVDGTQSFSQSFKVFLDGILIKLRFLLVFQSLLL